MAQSSKRSGGLTISWGDPQTTRATVSPTSHTNWREVMKFENTEYQESDRSFRLIFKWLNIHTSSYVSCSREEAKGPRSGAYPGTSAASGFSGGPQIRLPECQHRYNPRRHQRHQGSALLPLREQGSPRLCRRRRKDRKTYARQVADSYAKRGGRRRHFDRRCPAYTSWSSRRSSRLSAAPFVTRDVPAGRAIPQATREDIP